MNRYIIGFFIVLGLIVLLIVLLLGGSKHQSGQKPIYLPDYANQPNSFVSMRMDGPIISNQQHNYLTITANQDNVTFDLYQGYDNNLIKSKVYNNTQTSYRALLYALYYAGFDQGNNDPKLSNSTGYCAVGDVYTFTLSNNGKTISKYWDTNCSSTPSTYLGQLGPTISLFKKQVPDYYSLNSNTYF